MTHKSLLRKSSKWKCLSFHLLHFLKYDLQDFLITIHKFIIEPLSSCKQHCLLSVIAQKDLIMFTHLLSPLFQSGKSIGSEYMWYWSSPLLSFAVWVSGKEVQSYCHIKRTQFCKRSEVSPEDRLLVERWTPLWFWFSTTPHKQTTFRWLDEIIFGQVLSFGLATWKLH